MRKIRYVTIDFTADPATYTHTHSHIHTHVKLRTQTFIGHTYIYAQWSSIGYLNVVFGRPSLFYPLVSSILLCKHSGSHRGNGKGKGSTMTHNSQSFGGCNPAYPSLRLCDCLSVRSKSIPSFQC